MNSLSQPSNSLPSSASQNINDGLRLVQRLSQRHLDIVSLPQELYPASATYPRDEARVDRINHAIAYAMTLTEGDPTHPKWGYVSRLMHLACTSRGYVGAAPGVRVGDKRKFEVEDVEWMLPETVDEWREYERKWGHKFRRATLDAGSVSKYWRVVPERDERQDSTKVVPPVSKAEIIREKVTTWQAAVLPAGDDISTSKGSTETPITKVDKGKGKARDLDPPVQSDRAQRPLAFTVVKRSADTTSKGKNVATDPPKMSWKARSPVVRALPAPPSATVHKDSPACDGASTSYLGKTPAAIKLRTTVALTEVQSANIGKSPSQAPEPCAVVEEPVSSTSHPESSGHIKIAELSEMSFMPPSFPPQLQTSTPQRVDVPTAVKPRHKPSPIVLRSYPSSPLSSPPPTQNVPLDVRFSSVPLFSPTRKATKRRISDAASPKDPVQGEADISSQGVFYEAPSKKRPRVTPETKSGTPPPFSTPPREITAIVDEPVRPSIPANNSETSRHIASAALLDGEPAARPTTPIGTKVPVDVSTSLPAGGSVAGPSTPVNVRGLGNAKGLPVPTTPTRKALPTLTELLASSRRSKPRPRPPSRKTVNRPPGNASVQRENGPESANVPVSDESREPSPAPTRTYFSSPASASPESPANIRYRPRSPVSPLFTQNLSAFAPPFISSQPFSARHGDLISIGSFVGGQGQQSGQGSSNVFAMQYNSQFDVEGQVDRVSELLDRDVDFDGWLRDIPEEEGENQPLTKSQDEVVGF